MIRFFLGEEPILQNVPTWKCGDRDDLGHVLDNLHELVVKDVHGSGGYGMLVGPHATRAEREDFAERLRATPDRYIAQPTLALSTCPTFVENGRSEEHTSELQSLMRISYAVFCWQKKQQQIVTVHNH